MRGSERMRRQSSKLMWITDRGTKIGKGPCKACASGMKRLRDYLLAGGIGFCNHPSAAKKFLYVFNGGCGRQRYGSIQWTAVNVRLPAGPEAGGLPEGTHISLAMVLVSCLATVGQWQMKMLDGE